MKKSDSRTLRAILLLTAAALIAGCSRQDDALPVPETLPEGSVKLRVSLPAPAQKNMNTRAGAADFYVLRDLNVVIAEGAGESDRILSAVYFEPGSTASGTSVVGGTDLVVYTENGSDFSLHFSQEWLEYMAIPSSAAFFLVGNYGSRLSGVADVGSLRRLKDTSDPGMEGWVGSRHLMFGETGGDIDNPDHTHPGGRSLEAELRHTAAMITVKIDGSALARGVVIVPQSISLHNVPRWCLLGERNVVTTDPLSTDPLPGAVAPQGESLGSADLQWGAIAGTASATLNLSLPTTVGRHYTDWEESAASPTAPEIDWEQSLRPLFLYENVHGAGFGAANADERFKRPHTAAATPADIQAKTGACSYLEVRASYRKLDDNGRLTMGGEVAFRVFLGGDVLENFDVERNSYYRFTLTLSGNAVTEGGQIGTGGNLQPNPAAATWRVESDLSSMSMLSGSDFTLNAAGEMIFIEELLHEPDNSGMKVWYHYGETQQGANIPYIHMVTAGGWYPFPLNSDQYVGSNSTKFGILNPDGVMQFRLYVNPMRPDDGDGYRRRVTFNIRTNSGNYIGDTITLTQYAPIVRTIDAGNTSQQIRDYVTGVLGRSLPLTIRFDRVDRTAMPWGFEGASIAANQLSGFDNGVALLNDPAANPGQYLPFGKPNSAMMHAAFINYYQYQTPTGFTAVQNPPSPTVGAIAGAGLPADFDFVPNAIPSRAEWKLLEMLQNEDGEMFDNRHPVLPWFTYWTSDAVEGVSSRSYVYQVGQGLDRTDPANWPARYALERTTPVRYRFVSFE